MGLKMMVAGPVNMAKGMHKFIPFPEIGHREPEFEALYRNIKKQLFKLYNVDDKDFEVVVISGSGTSAMESVISSVVTNPLIITNGTFGERMQEICEIYKMDGICVHYNWGTYPNLKEIEELLIKNPGIKEVLMVSMETSTGMLNPIQQVGELCKKYNKTYILDAVCALGIEDIDMEKNNIDFCFASSNKGTGGPPVVGIVCCRKSKCINLQRRNMYLDLNAYLKYGRRNQTPFTPALVLFYIMNETLKQSFKEGISNRMKRYKENNRLLKKGIEELGLKLCLKDHYSHVMFNVFIPEGFTFKEIHDKLKRKGYLIYAGKGELEGKVMHIANIGSLTSSDIKNFIKTLKGVLKR